VRGEQRKIARGQDRQQQVAPAGMGAIQLHACPSHGRAGHRIQMHGAPTRARSRRRHWYATSMELVCAVSDKDAATRD
jgi:hypothetical protein